eukprot:1926051-Rhodomonas_salina.1
MDCRRKKYPRRIAVGWREGYTAKSNTPSLQFVPGICYADRIEKGLLPRGRCGGRPFSEFRYS